MMKLKDLLRLIDAINNVVGRILSFLLIPLMVITAIEVVSRYFFSRPTIWAWDINIQIFGIIVIFGGGFALLHNAHVSVDVVVEHLNIRVRAFLDLITSVLFFFAYGILLWQTGLVAWESMKIKELYSTTLALPIYVLKALIPLAVVLLFLQGIAKFIRDLMIVLHHKTEKE